MDEYKLTVEYSTKGADEVNEKTINVNLNEYEDSYKNESKQMQQYTRSEINKKVRPKKEQFIFESISKNLDDDQELVSLIDPLVDEVDEFVAERNR